MSISCAIRARVSLIAAAEGASLLRILQRVDKSFVRSNRDFRAVKRHGYLVDLIKPLRDPPWTAENAKIGDDPNVLEIEGLSWHESAPPFETTAIDEKGEPLRMVTSDPRIFAVHKLWLSRRIDRDPIKRRRDGEEARAVSEHEFGGADVFWIGYERVANSRYIESLRGHEGWRVTTKRMNDKIAVTFIHETVTTVDR